MSSKASNEHRDDIDGLRALAIIPVLLFHANVPGFSGGFVGVDIFFVISGYLITGILFREVQSGKIDIVKFYERRIRRIFPALFSCLAAVYIAGIFILLPQELNKLSLATISTVAFSSNFLYWLEAGYFDTESSLKPLLHTWSLAVEEQFYIFLPILIWALRRSRTITIVWSLILLAAASFVISNLALTKWASAAFFLLPSRAWELLAGSILAVAVSRRSIQIGGRLALAIAGGGVALILIPVAVYTEAMPFPGAFALPPVIGATILIAVGKTPNAITTFLSHKVLKSVGLISYSLYLWHWPIIAFLKICFGPDIMAGVKVLAILLSFGAAYLSYRFVETPFRKGMLRSRFAIMTFGVTCCCLTVSIAGATLAAKGLPSRLDNTSARIAAAGVNEARSLKTAYACEKIDESNLVPCPIGVPAKKPVLVVYGDSHAMALRDVLDRILVEKGIAGQLLAIPGCPPAFGLGRVNFSTSCGALSLRVEKHILEVKPKAVIIIGSWRGALYDKDTIYRGRESFDERSRLRNVVDALTETAAILRERSIYSGIALPVPGARVNVPAALSREGLIHYLPRVTWTFDEHRQRFSGLKFAALEFDSVSDLGNRFCDQRGCKVSSSSGVYYVDDNHVGRLGQDLVESDLMDQVEYLVGREGGR